jgi:dTDP-4-dehydrorhamnose reductase
MPIKVAAETVRPMPTTAFPHAGARPLEFAPGHHAAAAAFGLHLPHWQPGVERMLPKFCNAEPTRP